MRIGARIDQLRVDAHAITRASHRSLENMCDAKCSPNLAQIARARSILPNGSATDDFKIGNFGQVRQNIVLHTVGKVGVLLVITEIFKRKHSDAFFRRTLTKAAVRAQCHPFV